MQKTETILFYRALCPQNRTLESPRNQISVFLKSSLLSAFFTAITSKHKISGFFACQLFVCLFVYVKTFLPCFQNCTLESPFNLSRFFENNMCFLDVYHRNHLFFAMSKSVIYLKVLKSAI
jgi:hypothetical protein